MTTSDRIVALLIAIASVLIVVGFERVTPIRADQGRPNAVTDSRGEPFP